MMRKILGLNIDHIATLRNARGESYPSVTKAAQICLKAGADHITIHLREDRRHIRDADLHDLSAVGLPLNLEMAMTDEMLNKALEYKPAWVCLVPEKRSEITTEGGLDIIRHAQKLSEIMPLLRQAGIKVSLFLEPDLKVLDQALKLQADAIELHTGTYCKAFLQGDYKQDLHKIEEAVQYLKDKPLRIHAGHGLTYDSLRPLLQIAEIQEYNIGHFVIAQAVFDGLGPVVQKFRQMLDGRV